MDDIYRNILYFIGIAIIWHLALIDYGKKNIKNLIKTIILVVIAIILIRLRK